MGFLREGNKYIFMLNKNQRFGKQSEFIAVQRLKKDGYKIIEQNYRTEFGEIDIIAKDKDTLVFVEVKARKSNRFGSPKLALTHEKRKKISITAMHYLKATKQSNAKARFDVVAISSAKNRTEIEIIKNAFELVYS